MDLRDQIAELSDDELTEIRGAATWYAKFHARIIAERAPSSAELSDSRPQTMYNCV